MSILNCSECGTQVNSESETCPQCGSPLRPHFIQKKYDYLRSVLIFAICMAIFLFVYSLIHGGKLTSKSAKLDISVEAVNACQEFVTRKLIIPFMAEFPEPSQARVTKSGNNQYMINSYVDAQNRDGDKIRKNYECIVKYEPEKDRWYLVKITLEK